MNKEDILKELERLRRMFLEDFKGDSIEGMEGLNKGFNIWKLKIVIEEDQEIKLTPFSN